MDNYYSVPPFRQPVGVGNGLKPKKGPSSMARTIPGSGRKRGLPKGKPAPKK